MLWNRQEVIDALPDDEAIERMYSDVKIRLRKMGHRIISYYDQIF